MGGLEAYAWLMEASEGSGADAFDAHVAASILALAIDEAQESDGSICEGAGLGARDLEAVARSLFPAAAGKLLDLTKGVETALDQEEQSIRDILMMYATGESWLEPLLAAMIARRCRRPNHLWQDLGLRARSELSDLMSRHFAPARRRNAHDMKWKKFLYRMVCSTEGFTLCTAPVCTECPDFENCYGGEDGESKLARLRNDRELTGFATRS